MAHPVNRLVHARFFFDIGIGPRHIGFGLIIIIIGYEIFDRIVGEKTLKLAIKLRGEDFVRREDQRGPLRRFNHFGHGEGFAGTGDAQQHLVTLTRLHGGHQLGNRDRLVPRRGIFRCQRKGFAALRLYRARRAVRDEGFTGFRFVQRGADLYGHVLYMDRFCHRHNVRKISVHA